MRDRLGELGDADVAVITFSAPAAVAVYQRERLSPLTLLIDVDRRAYQSYGLARGPLLTVWGPKVWWAYAKLVFRGRRLRRPTEDTLQLGGDVIVGRDGRVAYVYRSRDPDDRPGVDDLVSVVRSLGSER